MDIKQGFALYASKGQHPNVEEWLVYCSTNKQQVRDDANAFKINGRDDQGRNCDDAYYTQTRIVE